MDKHFYIFRHGECPFNVTGHIQGQKFNGALTQNGIRQARRIGECLRDKNIEIILSSPMRRALQTAQIVRDYTGAPILLDHRFIEVNMGIVEGMHISVAEKRYADIYALWRNPDFQKNNIRFKGGESKEDVRKRIFAALSYYARETAYQNLAVSGHGITLSQTLLQFGIRVADIKNGAIVHMAYIHPQWKYHGFITAPETN